MDKLGKTKKYREWRAELRNRNRHKKREAAKQGKTCSNCYKKITCIESSRNTCCADFVERKVEDGCNNESEEHHVCD